MSDVVIKTGEKLVSRGSDLVAMGGKLLAKATAFKVGKTLATRGGVIGVGVAAAAGVGYLAYQYVQNNSDEINDKKKKFKNKLSKKKKDLSGNYKGIKGDKKIVV
ncbi:hypothetical protein [Autumnicola edwardsiae]|jgi:uncharacterized membrane protein YebE (DUF533 family)|uniref:Uncharacterized protein n=1 Tax=Autumnicola edwardsiae TaxID=3075594 RepID=A0ABU3CZG9_9FLAO|nr:hypothetical protein [Zunongwangia sp. F297]MDT0651641.1 hypothetical protein [Zunongwangia sp. F297]